MTSSMRILPTLRRLVRHGNPSGLLAVLLLATLSTEPAGADLITLKSGHSVQGEILKETEQEIFVDIGVDVIRIPRERIESRSHEKPAEADKPADAETDSPLLYRMADLPVRSVKDQVARFGEGVVLIETPGGLGSGFIISDRGHCVTNYHVIERETRIAATIFHPQSSGEFTRQRIDDVKIVATNPFFDLALLQIPQQEKLKFQPVYLARDSDQKAGDDVFAIGSPLGLERSVSRGIVSSRNRNFEGLVYIQTTAAINPGNSGGPLFNVRGEVVGVTNMKLTFGENLGFAIPVMYLKHFLSNLDAFAFDRNNPNTGYRYLEAPRRQNPQPPPVD